MIIDTGWPNMFENILKVYNLKIIRDINVEFSLNNFRLRRK